MDLIADAERFFEWLNGFATNAHQKTDDEGFAALARLAGKVKGVVTAPENAADIAAIGRMAAQDLPSLTAPKPMPLDAPQPYIAPAHQSPGDFNANSANREAST